VPTGSLETGTLLILESVNIARDVYLRGLAPTTGNIAAGSDFSLTSTIRRIALVWQQSSLLWVALSRSHEALSHLDEVFITPVTLTNGNVLRYDGTNWVNANITPVITERAGASTSIGATANSSATATCNAGEVSIGGGIEPGNVRIYINQSRRSGTTGWTITARNDAASSSTWTPYVICLAVPLV
jgi:hypothetical protein